MPKLTHGISKRRGKRGEDLLLKLETVARGGDFVQYDADGAPCVAVRLDELLAVVEWCRALQGRVETMRTEQRYWVERAHRKKQQQERRTEPFHRKKRRRYG